MFFNDISNVIGCHGSVFKKKEDYLIKKTFQVTTKMCKFIEGLIGFKNIKRKTTQVK